MAKPISAYDITVTPKILGTVLVKNSQREWFRFDLWEDRIFILDRREEYQNWEDFDSGFIDNDIEDLHEQYLAAYGKAAPKNAHKKTLTKALWAKMYLKSKDRTGVYQTGGVRNVVTGEKDRKRNLDRRGYRALEVESIDHLQNQALIVHAALLKYHKASEKEYITEGDVRDLMSQLRDTGQLKTKQDPFRIFQYYRPALIKAGKLEFIE